MEAGGGVRSSLSRVNKPELFAAARAHERHRRIVWNASTAALPKAINVLTVLVTVPLALGYLGAERYGLWMTISSLVTLFSFADLGLGYGLMNAIAEADGRGDQALARRHVASALVLLGAVALTVLVLFALTYPWLAGAPLFNVTSTEARQEVGPALAALVVCFALNLPLGVVQRVQMGFQAAYVSNLWQSVGSVLGLVGVVVAIRLEAGLPWLVLAMMGLPLVVTAANGLTWFRARRAWLQPRGWEDVSAESFRHILRLGLLFLALQVAGALAFASDNLVISRVLGAAAVPEYAVTLNLFQAVSLVLGMLLMPLWPAYGEALARRDFPWIRQTVRRSLIVSVALAVVGVFPLVLFGKQLVVFWTNGQVEPSFWLLLGFGFWKVMEAAGNAVSMFLNGTQVVRLQVVLGLSMAVAALAAKVALAESIGLPGVVWGVVLTYPLFSVLPHFWLVPRLLRNMEAR